MRAARFLRVLEHLRIGEFALARESCAVCGFALQVRLRREETAVRCSRCGASAVTQSLAEAVCVKIDDLASRDCYEMSAAGPLVRFLRARCRSLVTSEYFPDVPPGGHRGDTLCQNVERLTFPDQSFDLCTSTEVFEHVEDDAAGFAEIFRVLRPGGWHLFTVPLSSAAVTVERTAMVEGQRHHTLPAEYHADRFRGRRVFCYRNYGLDITARLRAAGFATAELFRPAARLFGMARTVVVARRPARA